MRARLPRLVFPCVVLAVVTLYPAIALPRQQQPPRQRDSNGLLIGVWQLNLAKSRYSPGPPPRRETRTYMSSPEGVKGVIERTHADGRVETIEYIASNYDRVYPVTGAVEYDAIELKRIDEYTSESVLSHAGRVFGTARRVISMDGRMMTIQFKRDSQNVLVNNSAIYEKLVVQSP